MRASRGGLEHNPVAGVRHVSRPGALDGGREAGTVERGRELLTSSRHQRIAREQRDERLLLRRQAEQEDDVAVGHGVPVVECQRSMERAETLGPLRPAATTPGGVVEPGLTQTVPGVRVRAVPADELEILGLGGRIVFLVKRLIGTDQRPIVRWQAIHEQGGAPQCEADGRIPGADHPSPRQRQLVVRQAECRVQRGGLLELAHGGREVPAVEVLDSGQIGPERFERRRGHVRQARADLGRRAGEIE